MFGLFGSGAEAKAHAGFGQLAAREAPALYYDPANLAESAGFVTPYGELDVISLKYSFTYEGYSAVEISKLTPLPFFGASVKPLAPLTVAVSLLPLPGGSSDMENDSVPSRDLFEDPIIVDAHTKGTGLGYRFAAGAAWRFPRGVAVGLSLLAAHSETELTAKTHDDGTGLLTQTKNSTTYQLLAGARAALLNDRLTLAASVRLPSLTKVKGQSVIPVLNNATLDTSGVSHGPLGLGFGAAGRVWRGLSPFAELVYQRWGALDEKAQSGIDRVAVAYQNTLDCGAGADFDWRGHVFTGAAGRYESPLADGVMKDRSPDGEEHLGMKLQNVDAMPRTVLSAGYARDFLQKKVHAQTGLSYASGARSVSERARGYGDYALTILTVIAGGAYKF